MVRKTKAEAEKTRDALLDAAERLFSDKGLPDTSLEDVAQAADVTRGALYWHFRNKVSLFAALAERAKPPPDVLYDYVVGIETSADLLDRLHRGLLDAISDLVAHEARQRALAAVFQRCNVTRELQHVIDRCQTAHLRFVGRLETLFDLAVREGRLAQQWTPQSASLVISATLHGLFLDWLQRARGDDFLTSASLCLAALFASFEA